MTGDEPSVIIVIIIAIAAVAIAAVAVFAGAVIIAVRAIVVAVRILPSLDAFFFAEGSTYSGAGQVAANQRSRHFVASGIADYGRYDKTIITIVVGILRYDARGQSGLAHGVAMMRGAGLDDCFAMTAFDFAHGHAFALSSDVAAGEQKNKSF